MIDRALMRDVAKVGSLWRSKATSEFLATRGMTEIAAIGFAANEWLTAMLTGYGFQIFVHGSIIAGLPANVNGRKLRSGGFPGRWLWLVRGKGRG